MVSDVMKRTERLDLARSIIREGLRLNGVNLANVPSVEITRAARVYLTITRHNTKRLRAKLALLKEAAFEAEIE